MPAPVASTADLPRLLQIARQQRGLMNCILASIAVNMALAFLPDGLPGWLLALPPLVLNAICLYFTIRLASVVFGLAGAIPCALLIAAATVWMIVTHTSYGALVVLLVMAVVNGRATTALRKAGFKVGLMGAEPRDVEARIQGRA